jgi:hypothetical protein
LWQLSFYKTFSAKKINSFNKKEVDILFRLFLTTRCAGIFYEIKQIIFSKKYNVKIYKYEELNRNILNLKKTLNFKNEKIKIDDVTLKSLSIDSNIKKKIKFNKDDIKLVKREAKYIFDRYNYSMSVPKKYIDK